MAGSNKITLQLKEKKQEASLEEPKASKSTSKLHLNSIMAVDTCFDKTSSN